MPILKIRNSKFEIRNYIYSGFTLVELLVVVGIMGLTVASTLIFLTSVIKGSNQASVTNEVKQNGQIVLDSLERQIRNGIDAELLGPNTLKITRSGLDPLYVKCFPADLIGPPARNGRIGTVVKATAPLDTDYVSLTQDTDLVSGVDIECLSPSFDVIAGSTTAPPIVIVSFLVNQGINAPSRQDFLANAQFQTTISLRQY